MRDFLKYTLATLTGLFIGGILLGLVFFIGLIGWVASATSEPVTAVHDNSVFTLKLEGSLLERYTTDPWDSYLNSQLNTSGLEQITAAIRKAKSNDKIKGIYLEAGQLEASPASLQAIRRELLDFKQSGKFIVAYSGHYGQGAYYLSSVADKVILNPAGSLDWKGLSATTVFYKGLLEKAGIEMQVFRVGTYKSAVEPFVATEMSPANRRQTQAFLDDTWRQLLGDVADTRRLTAERLQELADRHTGLAPAEEAVRSGLADTLMYKDQVLAYLKQLTGTDEDDRLETLDLGQMAGIRTSAAEGEKKDQIAVYYAFGEIDGNGSDYGKSGINSERVICDLRDLRTDDDVKAVVLRINSPGGSAYGSEQIWREVCLLQACKPVVVSMGDYAASGGYYIACAADHILAESTTLTGSIGVFGLLPNARQLFTDKLGLRAETVKTGGLADIGSTVRPLTAAEKAGLQQGVEQTYELFTRRCAEGRHLPQDSVKAMAEGRVWSGQAALRLGLVDELGGLRRAVEVAAAKAGIDHYAVAGYPQKESTLDKLLSLKADSYIHSRLQALFGVYGNGLGLLRQLDRIDRIQARLPFDLEVN